MIVRLAHAAEAELEAAMAWYDGEAPRSFTSVGPGGRYRRALVARFRYQVIFEVGDEDVRDLTDARALVEDRLERRSDLAPARRAHEPPRVAIVWRRWARLGRCSALFRGPLRATFGACSAPFAPGT